MGKKFNILDEAKKVKMLMLSGQITYEQAVDMLQPHIKIANMKAQRIAKAFGFLAPKITAIKLLRQ